MTHISLIKVKTMTENVKIISFFCYSKYLYVSLHGKKINQTIYVLFRILINLLTFTKLEIDLYRKSNKCG